jgi:ribokinase
MPRPKVCVVGSSNLDMNAHLSRFPRVGETLHGLRFATGNGGKGANQAVMAARLGADVRFIARVGDDVFGRDMLNNFRREGIDTAHIRTTAGVSSGVAIITVDGAGQNTIIVIPGANGSLAPADVEAAGEAVATADVLVCQMEVPLEANLAALRIAAESRVPVIFNPAPAPVMLPDEVYRSAHVLCLNETETAILSGRSVESLSEAVSAARLFLARGAANVIVTLGSHGCLLVSPNRTATIPAPAVKAVDTTGAGDAFVGCLAFELARGSELSLAAGRACRIAAVTVQEHGTQSSYPRADECEASPVLHGNISELA